MRDFIVHDVVHGSVEWLALHIGRPTTSNFDRIITPKTGKLSSSSIDLAYDLLSTTTVEDMLGGTTSSAMMAGLEREPEAREYYALATGNKIHQVGFIEASDGRFGCSPDGLVTDLHGSLSGGLEIKCPKRKTHVKYLLEEELPPEYKPQVHGCLAITGFEWWDFMSYCRGEPPLLVRVHRDAYTVQLAACMEEFWGIFSNLKEKLNGLRGS